MDQVYVDKFKKLGDKYKKLGDKSKTLFDKSTMLIDKNEKRGKGLSPYNYELNPYKKLYNSLFYSPIAFNFKIRALYLLKLSLFTTINKNNEVKQTPTEVNIISLKIFWYVK
ncbi:hypothetical protein ACQKMI_00460 [Lysinibacillus sp. NPDC097214]|uniref:hypothetical protein n=1 Tax=Lysinibacillus sp. NPDC097214 TaxID=3390584 RepID=UPI003CFECD71